ncbi:MAG: hypothetical protein PVG24_13685, partial [Gammaproteobacteria bacterium]
MDRSVMKFTQAAAVFFVLEGLSSTSLAQSVDEGEGMRVQRDITYAVVDDSELAFDLYMPQATEQSPPLIVWVHGGAWRFGSRESVEVI